MYLPALGFVALYAGSILGGLVRWPLLTLAAYMLAFYGHPPSRWWGAGLPDIRWSMLAAAAALVAALIYKTRLEAAKSWHQDTIFRLIVAYVAWMWIQTPFAVDQVSHMEGVVFMTKYLLIVFVIVRLLETPESLRYFSILHVVGGAYFGLLARAFGSAGERLDGVGGPGVDDANTLGMQLATGVVLGAAQVVSGPVWSRAICIACMPFLLNGLILTQSRGAFLGLAAGGMVLVMFAPKGARATLRVLAIIGVLALGALATKEFWDRMDTIAAEEQQRDFSAQSRVVIAQAQLRMFADRPLGSGHRGTAALSPQYLSEEYLARNADGTSQGARSSHNTPLTVLVEQGIIGMVLYVALLITVARRFLQLRHVPDEDPRRRELALQAAAVGGALAVVFASGQFTDYLRAEVQMWLLAMLMAATRMSQQFASQEAESPALFARPTPYQRPALGTRLGQSRKARS